MALKSHNLESIGIEGKEESLIKYTYKNGNGRLKQVTYANGHTMKASYNAIGQLVSEKWYSASGSMTAHYQYVYDGSGNIVRSIDVLTKKEYTYVYEDSRLTRHVEYDITLDANGIITGKTPVSEVRYVFDAEGQMTGC